MRKNLFSDPFSFVQNEKKQPQPVLDDSVETTWVDKRTGAEYRLKDSKPTGPQGDFRVPKDIAEERYRTVMGLPSVSFGPRPVENPFEQERLEPERAAQHRDVEETVRERITMDTRRQLAIQQTNEPAPWASNETGDIEDHGDYLIDHHGRIKDKPANREGPFGKVKELPTPMNRPIFGEQTETVIKQNVNAIQNVPKKGQVSAFLEERLESKRGLQVLLTSAFRGLFGSQVADHILTRSINDGRETFDRPVLSKTIMDAGLMKPWAPHAAATGDRRIRPDLTAMEVGQRALRTLMKGPLAPEIQDLPKAERDDVVLALGRTILNSVMPSKSGLRPEFEDSLKKDLTKSISLAISPAMVAGLVPSDLLDNRVKTQNIQERTTNVSNSKAHEIPERKFISEAKHHEDRSLSRAPTMQNIMSGHQKKNIWAQEDFE